MVMKGEIHIKEMKKKKKDKLKANLHKLGNNIRNVLKAHRVCSRDVY